MDLQRKEVRVALGIAAVAVVAGVWYLMRSKPKPVTKTAAKGKWWCENKSELTVKEKPACPRKKSYKVTLKKGESYCWCTCGHSKKQPFCDGAHRAHPGYKPLKFTWNEDTTTKGLCGCKRNKDESLALCDGKHKDESIDW